MKKKLTLNSTLYETSTFLIKIIFGKLQKNIDLHIILGSNYC